jgi:HEAT repeat protein
VAGAYLAVSGILRQEYVRALVARIREGRLNLDDLPPGAVRLGQAEVQALARELDDADPRTRAFLVEVLGRLGGPRSLEAVRRRLADSTPPVRVAALQAIATIGDARAFPWTLPLLADEVAAVRVAAVRAATTLGGPLGALAVAPRLADPDGEVRVAAAQALAVQGPEGERAQAIAALEALAASGAPRQRAQAAAALSTLGLPLPAGTRAALLKTSDAEVRRAAVELEHPSDEDLSLLVRALGDPAERVRRAASDRLVAAGEAASLPLVAQFPALPEAGARLALACLVRIGSPAQQEEVDFRVAGEIERAARDTPLRRALASPDRPAAYELLHLALEHAHQRAVQHALALATARSSERLAREIAGHLASPDARRRADAYELLLNLLPARCGKALGALSDAVAAGESIAPAAVLAEYVDHPDAWVRAGAYYAIGRLGRGDLASMVRLVHADTPLLAALVAETQAHLTSSAEPRRLASAGAARDSIPPGHPLAAANGSIQDDPAIKGAYAVLDQLLSLHKVPLFRELTLEQLQALSPLLEEREYLAGEQIVREGDEGHELFVVLAGAVRIVRGSGRQTVVLGELGPQDYFGEMALLAERPRAATAVAASDCRLGVLAKEHFLAVLSERPEISLAVIQVLSNRLAEANDRLVTES